MLTICFCFVPVDTSWEAMTEVAVIILFFTLFWGKNWVYLSAKKKKIQWRRHTSWLPYCVRCAKLETEVEEGQGQTTSKCVKRCYQYESFQRPEAARVVRVAEITRKLRAKLNAWPAFKWEWMPLLVAQHDVFFTFRANCFKTIKENPLQAASILQIGEQQYLAVSGRILHSLLVYNFRHLLSSWFIQ